MKTRFWMWLLVLALSLGACDSYPPAPVAGTETVVQAEWPTHRHENLGVAVRYPPAWLVDSQEWFVWFFDSSLPEHGFNIANANFGMKSPEEFLQHLEIPVVRTRLMTLDGQPALFVELEDVPEAEGYLSVVAVITPYGENLTLGNKSEPAIFEGVLSSVRFFKPAFLP